MNTVHFPTGANAYSTVSATNPFPVTSARTVVVDVTLSTDTSAYASGDLIANTQVVTDIAAAEDLGAVLGSVTVVDEDDQGAAFDIYFLDANNSFGTENAAPSITDANARAILGRVAVGTGDYKDLGGVRIATLQTAIPLKPATGTRDIYVAVVNGTGTPTYTASGLKLRLGLLQDK